MPIAITANSLQHWPSPSKQRPVSHRSTTVGQVCRTGLTTGERVIDFSIFELGGLPLGPRSPQGEMTYYPPRSTILQNFSPIAQTVYEICITKVFHFLAKVHQKGRWPDGLPRSTTMQNFIALRQPTPEISVTRNPADKQKNRKTVTNISQHAYWHVAIKSVVSADTNTYLKKYGRYEYHCCCRKVPMIPVPILFTSAGWAFHISWSKCCLNVCLDVNHGGMNCNHWTQRATSLFGLVFRSVFSLSPKTNLTPEFLSQSEVQISWAETGAKIATKNTRIIDFRFTRKIFIQIFIICCFALH